MISSTMMNGATRSRASQARNAAEPTTIAASQAHVGTRASALPKLDLGEAAGDLPRLGRLRRDPDLRRRRADVLQDRVVDGGAAGSGLRARRRRGRRPARRRARDARALRRSSPSSRARPAAPRGARARPSAWPPRRRRAGLRARRRRAAPRTSRRRSRRAACRARARERRCPTSRPSSGCRRFTRTSLPAMSAHSRDSSTQPSRTSAASSRPSR